MSSSKFVKIEEISGEGKSNYNGFDAKVAKVRHGAMDAPKATTAAKARVFQARYAEDDEYCW